MGKHDVDNRADQLNPNNDAYWQSQGFDERPDDWEEPSHGEREEDHLKEKDIKRHH